MSALCSGPIRWLVEDVLLQIFQHLDGRDLLCCEAVCHQWQQVMLNGTPWRRWLNQRSALPEVRPFWQRARLDESFQDYRAICRYILLLDYNWRLGKYEESSLTLLRAAKGCQSPDRDSGNRKVAEKTIYAKYVK